MGNSRSLPRRLALTLLDSLLALYPPRFREAFLPEIREVLFSRVSEAEAGGWAAWLAVWLHEATGLILSISRESWHELRSKKEKKMASDDAVPESVGGGMVLKPNVVSGLVTSAGWVLLSALVLPLAIAAAPPVAVLFLWLANLGARAGLWGGSGRATLMMLGFAISLAAGLAGVQTGLLRRFLPRPGVFFAAAGVGMVVAGLIGGVIVSGYADKTITSFLEFALLILALGLVAGVMQWLLLRRILPKAYLLVAVNLLATGSLLLAGANTNHPLEILALLLLPGAIIGAGYALFRWLVPAQAAPAAQGKRSRLSRSALAGVGLGVGLASLAPLFFAFLWVYASSQLALAKNEGAYPTVEAAVIGYNSKGWGGAKVVSITEIETGPNRAGEQPHVWFGLARVKLDRIPNGFYKDNYSSGSYYIHTREGWVLMPEQTFPELIGWVMELYNLEGARQ